MSGSTTNANTHLRVNYIRNFPFPDAPMFKIENIEASLDYKSRDNDIMLCSYPKTGTTWVSYIVWQILHKGEPLPPLSDFTFRLMPFMEMTGTEVVDALAEPRFYKNHFPYQLLNINEKAKYIYVHRNPEDTLASYYHFSMEFSKEHSEFDEFFEAFLTDEIAYGNFFDHVSSFLAHRNDGNVLILSYEELKKDIEGQVLRIAKFLGDEYYEAVAGDGALLRKILNNTSFDYMKKNLILDMPTADPTGPSNRTINFFRKGIVGDGKSLMSEEQRRRLEDKRREKMTMEGFQDLWKLP